MNNYWRNWLPIRGKRVAFRTDLGVFSPTEASLIETIILKLTLSRLHVVILHIQDNLGHLLCTCKELDVDGLLKMKMSLKNVAPPPWRMILKVLWTSPSFRYRKRII